MLSGLLLAMAGCSPAIRQGPPAPIIGPGGASTASPTPSGNVTVTPLKAPEITAVQQAPAQTHQRPEPAVKPEPVAPVAVSRAEASQPPAADARETVAMATPPRSTSKAVKTLLQQAELQRSASDLTGAAATLERALRIEPDNAYVWNRLAHVRAEQGQAGLAGELAAKSNAFAGGDEALKRDNEKLIARSRSP
jgi:hypothetical protein